MALHFLRRNIILPYGESSTPCSEQGAFAFATIMADGSAQVYAVWFAYDGEFIRINPALGA